MSVNLSRLKQVDLREAWQHEAYDFTNWLAEEDNIELLSDEIGVEISIIENVSVNKIMKIITKMVIFFGGKL